METELKLKLTDEEKRGLVIMSNMSLGDIENVAIEPGDAACVVAAAIEIQWAFARQVTNTKHQLKE